MINNYDSVVACASTATPHSQKQEGTSYTATKRNWLSLITVFVAFFSFVSVKAQVTTNGGSGLDGTYPSLASAITALNAATISAPVEITLTGNETAPAGGYSITATGTSTNTITIQGSTSIISAATGLTAGSKTDAIFKIIGGDYITIQNFTMVENSANTTSAIVSNNMTEFGVALFASSATNGAQNNTIKNNIITLSSATAYQNAIGVFSTSASSSTNGAQAATSIAGTNSNNKFYSNTISGVAHGFYFISPVQTATIFESGNDIGGSSSATGNIITYGISNTAGDLGFTSYSGTTPAGVYFRNVVGNSVRYNTITSQTGLTLTSGGIFSANGTNPTGVTYTSNFSNNNITITNASTTAVTGIDFGSGLSTGTLISSNNTITINQTATAANSAAVIGIKANYATATNTSSSNTIVFNQSQTTGALSSATTGITIAGASTTLTASSNSVTFNQTGSGTGTITGAIIGVDYSAAATTINSFSNAVLVNQTTAVASGITNAITGIKATSAATTANIGSSGNGNTITVKQAVTGSGSFGSGSMTYINAAAAHATLNIIDNVINNTGSVQLSTGTTYAISHNGTITTGLTINNNTINLALGSTGPSIYYGLYSFGSTVAATTYNVTNNNISLANAFLGSTAVCIYNLDGPTTGTPANKVFTGNSLTVTGNAATLGGLTVGYSNAVNVSGNTYNISSGTTSATQLTGINLSTYNIGAHTLTNNTFNALNFTGVITTNPLVVGIAVAVGNGANIYGNTIRNISVGASTSSGSPIVDGILLSGATLANVYQNKIYGITTAASGTGTVVNGIRISGGTANNIYNNLIGGLSAPAAASVDALRGISITSTAVTSTQKIYYNTIYLNGSSTGANFGSSGIFHTYSATGTTSALDLRNNIIVNGSAANGTGLAVAFRRSAATDLANFAITSNNNLYFGTNGIYTDGTNTDATLAAYKTRVSTRDTNSISNNPTFASTTGSDATYLHFDPVVNNVGIDRGAVAISPYTTDFDGNTRDASNPDIGADEFTAVVACATYSAPADAATGQAQTGVQLTWTAAANATGYDVYFDQNATPTTVVATNQAGTTYNTGILAASTTYYWKIVPKNGAGAASCATVWSFTTPAAVPTLGTIPSAPAAVAFTNVCKNTTSAAVTFKMNGINLTGTDVTITAPAGFTISEDNLTFSSSIIVNHTSGMFTDKLIYVKFSPTTTTAYASTITISGGGLATNVDVALTGTVIESLNGLYSVGATNLAGEAGHFATLTAAVTAYNSLCLTGPVVFSLTDTSYSSAETFPIVVNANTLASATNTLTIKPATGVVTSITGSSTAAIIKLNGADYVILDGSNANATDKSLTIANTNTGTSSAVIWMASIATPLNGATNNTVKNCIITGNAPATTLAGVFTSGASIGTSADAGNTNNTIQNNLITAAYYGVGMAGSADGDASNSILNNTIGSSVAASKIGLQGVFISNQNNVIIKGNTIFGITNAGSATTNIAGIYASGIVSNGEVSTNSISDVKCTGARSAYGIQLASSSTASGLTIFNNIIFDINCSSTNATLTRGGHGIAIITGGGYKLYYNTVNLNSSNSASTTTGISAALYVASGVTSLDIRNNIFANSQTLTTRYAIYSDAANTAYTTIDYNNYSCAGTALGFLTSARTALGDIVTGFGQNANSKAITPNFVSATDMHMNLGTNLAFENLATPIAGITTDIDGEVRSGSTPDIGADEFTTLDCTTQTLTAGTVSATNPALCGTGSTTITATGYTIGINTTYEWESATDMAFTTPVSMGAASATYTNLATGTISATTYYRLKTICSGTTIAYATPIAVVVNTPAVTTVSAAVTICNGTSTTLTAAGSTNYAWSPATGLSATTGTSVTASPTATTTYTVTGTDANGCTTTATVVVTVSPVPSAITIAPPAAICSGGTATLSSSGGNVTSAGTVAIGSATTLTAAATTEPTAFNNRYKHYWMQMVFTPSELSAAGLSAGNISAVKFNITTLGDASNVTDLKVRMGNAASGTLTTFQSTGLTLVKTAATYPYVVGENTITFDTPYTWDGTSNLIFDLRSTGADNLYNAITYYTATTGNTVATATTSTVSTSDGFAATIPTATLSTKRLNTQFVGVISAPGSIIWSPTTDLYTDAAATTAYTGTAAAVVYAKLTAPATYTATSTLGSCSVSTPVTVTPNPLPTITLDATTPVCNGGTSSSLSYTATTGTPTQYTIDFNAAAELAGFADVLSYTTLNSSIALTVPAGAAPGTYTGTITVKNATTGCVSATPQTFTVVINTPVAITTQPSNSVSLVNSNASFTVAATGSGLTYQWQESTDNGVTWNNISGATSATYTAVSVTNAMNGYQYQCIVSGATPCTSVTSSVVSLTISTTAIATQPLSTTICSNETATFTIATTGTTPTYQWQISTNSGTSWSDIAGETTTTLTVSGLTAATTQRYRCVLSGLINSDAAILTVNDIVAITTQPTDVTVCSNAANATFTTVATGTGLTYQWQQRANSSGTWANVGTGTTGGTTATLTISTLSTSLDGYQYQCIVTGTAPCVGQTTTTATLSVTGYTLANSTTGDKICIGGSVTFTATPTTSSPALTYSWVCATAGSGATTPVTGSVATITPTQVGSYTYTLTATGGSCSFTSTQTIVVNVLPVITTATANPTVACAGSTINLAATIVENGPGTITLGAGASTSTSSANNPFYGGYGGVKTQYLFRASELTALGLTAGNITSLGLDITTVGATLSGFGVNIASTTLTALTTNIETVTNNVFTGTFTPVMGVNTITFSSPFNWDGSSNIIVSFCWSNANTSNTASTVKVDTTPFVSANARYVDSQTAMNVCSYSGSATPSGWNGASTSSSTRPKFLFSGIKANNNTANYDWSWSDGSATVLSIASGTATLPAGATTTYTVTATNPTTGCSASQNVTVSTAVSALALTGVTPATSNICVGTSVTLTAAPTGGCIPYTYSWSDGTTTVGTTASITVSPTSTKTYTVTVVDNTGTATVNASSTITVNNPQPASVVNQTICAASSAFTLSAVASGTGNLLNWYAGSTGGSVLASGATFTTPSLSAATTTYYVEENALGTATTGLGRVSTTSVTNTTPSTYGLVFNLNAKSKLNSVDVYLASTTAGNLVVQLQNSTGTVINSKTIAVPAGNATTPVQYTVPLDFIIPAGTGYRLLAISGTAMVRESALGGFPYSLSSFGNITNGYAFGGASTTYYYFYNWSLSDVCTGIRVPVTATLNAPPVVTLGSPSATICSGQSTAAIALTSDPSSFTGYTWSPATGVSGSTTGWTFNPTSTTTYTLNATDGTCSNTATFTVNVNPSPSAMTITPAAPSVCVDAIQALTVSGGTISNVSILNETFNGTTTGWTAANNSSGGTPANAAWQIYISDINASSSNDNSNFIGSNSDAQGSGGTTDTSLTSPVFNLSNFTSASLKFYHHLDVYLTQPDTGKVQVSTNGTNWNDVITYTTDQGTITGFVLSTINLNAYVGNPSVQIRFKYNASYGNFWLIDNVSVSGTTSTQITWSPDTNLYTNAAATTPYTLGTNATTVYVKSASAATTTYTAKATAAVTNCETTATVDVIVNPNNTVSTASTTPTVCINTAITDITHTTTGATGIATTTTNYGLPAGVTANWSANTITFSGTPTAAGTFNYTIPLGGGCGTFSATGTITVTANNTASTASSTPTVCINTAITDITHTTTGATGIATTTTNYGLPAGVLAVLASNTITISGTPTASGTFNYDIPLTGGCGTVSATGTITVTANNTASAASTTPTVCINTAITDITHTTTGATGIATTTTNYGLPAGVTAVLASNTITISGTPTASGTFNYTIPLTGGCGTVSATGTITVTPLPGWFNTQFPSSASICEGGSAVIYGRVYLAGITDPAGQASGMTAQLGYSSSNTDPNTWTNWINASFNVQTGNDDEFLANIGSSLGVGTYFYAFRYSYNGCTYVYGGLNGPWNGTTNNSGTLTITANNTASAASSSPTVCINTAITAITHTTTGATGIATTTTNYGLPAGVTAVLASNTITISGTPTASGTFNYDIPLTGGCGTVSATGTITVTAASTNSTTTSACGTYTWSVNGTTYTTSGTYTSVVGCLTETLVLTINALPVATITRAGDDLTATETGATYQWYNCTSGSVGALISGATTQSYTATATGSYAVEVTKNGCSEMSACFDVATLSGNSFDLAKLSYYPNPVIDVLTISYTNEITAVQVYDISGRLVRDMKPNSNEVTVDLSDLAASVYVVKVFADTTSGEFKVVKK